MRASDYLTAEERLNVAEAGATGAGAALLAAARRERRRIEAALGSDAKVGCERIEDDIRFHLGMMRGLEFMERLRGCARRELNLADDDGE